MSTNITIDTIKQVISQNSESIRIIDVVALAYDKDFDHLKDQILNLSFSCFVKTTSISSELECESALLEIAPQISGLKISDIQEKLKCDKIILQKVLKNLAEPTNDTDWIIKTTGSRKGMRYTLIQKPEASFISSELEDEDLDGIDENED